MVTVGKRHLWGRTIRINAQIQNDKARSYRLYPIKLAGLALICFVVAYYSLHAVKYSSYQPVRSSRYLWAVYHVHSTSSDGVGSPEEIAREAKASGISIVFLTEHDAVHPDSFPFRTMIDGVTLISGIEARIAVGRFTYFSPMHIPSTVLSRYAPDVINHARDLGAFPILAYTQDSRYGWRYWGGDLKPDGLEILNLFTNLRESSLAQKVNLLAYYPFSRYYFLKSVSVSQQSLDRWDDLLRRGKSWAFIASDAHGGFHVGKRVTVSVPSYADTFALTGLGIDKIYASDPESAIRNGDFFDCIRGAGEPALFDFYAVHQNHKFTSGSNPPAGAALHVRIQTDYAIQLILKKDGQINQRVFGDNIDVGAADTGTYRVEVYILRHPFLAPTVPWIISNPIFIGPHFAGLNSPSRTTLLPSTRPAG